MKEVYEKKKLATPIVFAAVPFPFEMGLIISEAASGNQLTGVKDTTDLDPVDRGVPYAYGVSELIYGEEAAKKALLILDEYMLPRDIPITTLPSESFQSMKRGKVSAGMEPDGINFWVLPQR
jgi:ABC-type uncharacterized transport system substrate-binding protein